MTRVVGIDLSLTSTGMAFVGVEGEVSTIETSTIKSAPDGDTIKDRWRRLIKVSNRVVLEAFEYLPDLVVIEGPSFNSKGAGTWDRAGLWWLTISGLLAERNRVIEASPSTRMKYATGKGRADKDVVMIAATRRYPDVEFKNNDEADALILAAIGSRLLGSSIEPSLPVSHIAALDPILKTWEVPVA